MIQHIRLLSIVSFFGLLHSQLHAGKEVTSGSRLRRIIEHAASVAPHCITEAGLIVCIEDQFKVSAEELDVVLGQVMPLLGQQTKTTKTPTSSSGFTPGGMAPVVPQIIELACMLSSCTEEELKQQKYTDSQIEQAKELLARQEKMVQQIQSANERAKQPLTRKNSLVKSGKATEVSWKEHERQPVYDADGNPTGWVSVDYNEHRGLQGSRPARPVTGDCLQEVRSGKDLVGWVTQDYDRAQREQEKLMSSRFVVQEVAEMDELQHREEPERTEQEQTKRDAKTAKTVFDYAREGKWNHLQKCYKQGEFVLGVTTKQGLTIRDCAAQGFDKAWRQQNDGIKADCLSVIKWYDKTRRANTTKCPLAIRGG